MVFFRFLFDNSKIFILFFFIFTFVSYANQDFITYKINKGDTFYSLSKRFNVEIWQIQQINKITDLKYGQVIKIPNRTFLEYKVKKGDTLFSLARKFNSTIEEILSVNSISDFNIKGGQVLKIPVKMGSSFAVRDDRENKKYNRKVYIVKKGDTLYSISKKLGVSVDYLSKINNLSKGTKLRQGMILLVRESKVVNASKKVESNKDFSIPNFSLPFKSIISVENRYDKFIDVQLSKPEIVTSLDDGVVIFIGTFGVFGRTIIIKHGNNFYGVYGLLNEIYVENGQKVTKGQKIGTPVFDDSAKGFKFKLSFIVGDKMMVPDKKLVKL
jgi:LysM repeat protein